MEQAMKVVQGFRDAFYSGDSKGARQHLADEFQFTGPTANIPDPDKFVKTAGHVASGLRSIEIRKAFVDGDDVCVIFDLLVDHEVGRMQMVDWYHLKQGVISSIWTLFDMAPFMQPSGATVQDAGTAIDPVCHMSVDKSAPTAKHVHEGTVFHFCSEACADAFQADPGRYLPTG
jgi:YHS domain-containing protein